MVKLFKEPVMLIGYQSYLTPWGHFLWNYLKRKVYKNNAQLMPEGKDEILQVLVIDEI